MGDCFQKYWQNLLFMVRHFQYWKDIVQSSLNSYPMMYLSLRLTRHVFSICAVAECGNVARCCDTCWKCKIPCAIGCYHVDAYVCVYVCVYIRFGLKEISRKRPPHCCEFEVLFKKFSIKPLLSLRVYRMNIEFISSSDGRPCCHDNKVEHGCCELCTMTYSMCLSDCMVCY